MSKKYAKPYPKSYILAAAAFAILLCGVWAFYGMLYQKDMQVINHCKMSAMANTVAENLIDVETIDEARITAKEINTLANSFDLNDVETECLSKLNDDMKALERNGDNSSLRANAERSAKRLAGAAQDNAEIVMSTSKKSHIMGDYFMMTLWVLVIAAILIIGQFVRKKESAIAAKEAENRRLESNVQHAKDKVYEAAYTNLLMECGNRYALEEAISEKVQNKESFCAVRLNLCDFDNLLTSFGYSAMDTVMSKIAGKIKERFEDSGSLYAVSDESLVFVFHADATLNEVLNKAERMRQHIMNEMNVAFHINTAVAGAVLCSNHFRDKGSDAILTALHSASLQCPAAAPLLVV